MASIDLQACEASLREGFLRARRAYEQDHPGSVLRVTCTHRPVSEQQRLYARGRTEPGSVVTQVDGVTQLSKHNHFPSKAIDFCVTWAGKVSWVESDYDEVGPYLVKEGLIWGGDWPTFKDRPHTELP